MTDVYTVSIELTVTDRAALAAYAKDRAIDCGLDAREFNALEEEAYSDDREIDYWLTWVFDNGSPPGIEIQDTSVEVVTV